MNFKFYKFCQLPSITILSSVYAMFHLLYFTNDWVWWGALIIGIIAALVAIAPIIGIIHPITNSVYMLVALFNANDTDFFFYLLIGVFVLHIFRNVCWFYLTWKYPSLSRDYDALIRRGL